MRETMLGVQSDRVPLTKEQIRRSRPVDSWVSPNYGDGGWHATPGCEDIDPYQITPLRDRIVVQLLPERSRYDSIVHPESETKETRFRNGIVIRLGTGKRVEDSGNKRWPFSVQPGDFVQIGPYHDWLSQDGKFVLCQEADVRYFKRGRQ